MHTIPHLETGTQLSYIKGILELIWFKQKRELLRRQRGNIKNVLIIKADVHKKILAEYASITIPQFQLEDD